MIIIGRATGVILEVFVNACDSPLIVDLSTQTKKNHLSVNLLISGYFWILLIEQCSSRRCVYVLMRFCFGGCECDFRIPEMMY